MENNEGGPAFPQPCTENGYAANTPYGMAGGGMSMRDYFAAKALPAVYSDYCASAEKIGFDEGWKVGVAMDAYAMADAMLKARNA